MKRVNVPTAKKTEMVDVTRQVQLAVAELGIRDGVCHVYVPHTTAAVTINESADPMVPHDVLHIIDRLIPFDDPGYRHVEGNSAAHLKAMVVGSSETVLVEEGRLVLGTWQGIFFCEFDGPRSRHLLVK